MDTSRQKVAQQPATIAWVLFLGGASVFVAALALYLGYFARFGASPDPVQWSNFGQYFGGLAGTGVAVVTLAAVAYNIVLQQRELSQASAHMEAQSKALAQQAFDSVFFQLLKTFVEVRGSIGIQNHKSLTPQQGAAHVIGNASEWRELFARILAELHDDIGKPTQKAFTREAYISNGFAPIYTKYEIELGPYFRTLYHVFKFIDRNASLTEEEKFEYAGIARAQLSIPDLCIIFYDGLLPIAKDFKLLIERYGLLKHLRLAHLAFPDFNDQALYAQSAFMTSGDRRRAASRAKA